MYSIYIYACVYSCKVVKLEPELMNCTHTHTFMILTLYNQSVCNPKHKQTHDFQVCHKEVEWYNEIIIIIIIIFVTQSLCSELSTERTLRVPQTKLLKPLARGVTQESKWAHRKPITESGVSGELVHIHRFTTLTHKPKALVQRICLECWIKKWKTYAMTCVFGK